MISGQLHLIHQIKLLTKLNIAISISQFNLWFFAQDATRTYSVVHIVLDIDGFLKEYGVWVKDSSIDFLTTNFGLYVTAKEMENATQEDDLRRFLNYLAR